MAETPFQSHYRRWANCQRCLLSKQRQRICLARGTVPCDVLFIGEAPGSSEDALGKPFCGPAGHLLDQIIEQSLGRTQIDVYGEDSWGLYSYALTNLVACFPRQAKDAGVNEPPEEAIEACAPRLAEFVRLSRPKLIVLVGKLAEQWGPDQPASISITHPAAILRMDVSQKGLAVQRAVVTIADAVEEI